jgi:tripartite-type tricarboxylate transporter receptor subunit TctC
MTVERFASILNVAFALIALGASGVQAQSWPTQSVRMIVGFAPGGTADILARKLQTPLSARLGQPIVIENRPGASGAIATAEVARASDGHTFALVVSTHVNHALEDSQLQDWLRANALQRGATTPEGFRDFVAKEIERSKVIAETAKISVE